MKRKIVGILVVTLLIATAVLPVVGTMNFQLDEINKSNTLTPILNFSPTSHDFGFVQEGNTYQTTFDIWNAGTGSLDWHLAIIHTWLSPMPSPFSGSSTGEHDTVTVTIDTTGLSPGSHEGFVSIYSNGGDGTFYIYFTISTAVLSFDPIQYFEYDEEGVEYIGEDETFKTTFDIWNTGTGTLNWDLGIVDPEISVNPMQGQSAGERDTVIITVNTAGLAPGEYEFSVGIYSNGGNSYFDVLLEIIPNTNMKLIANDLLYSGAPIPVKNTCDGEDVSPRLSISGVPGNTDSLVLIMYDEDAIPIAGIVWDHWVVYNIPESVFYFPEDAGANGSVNLPQGCQHGLNSMGHVFYEGPCPPPPDIHNYYFKLYALDISMNPWQLYDKLSLLEDMNDHVIAESKFCGTFSRDGNHPPNQPTKPDGPSTGKTGENLHFESYFSDPDGDSMEILFDWGDGTNTGWLGPVASGTTVGNYHSWNTDGIYQVRTKARDTPYLAESEWSEFLTVTIGESQQIELITQPRNAVYLFGIRLFPLSFPEPVAVVLGSITIEVDASGIAGVERIDFSVDDIETGPVVRYSDYNLPYEWDWNDPPGLYVIGAQAISSSEKLLASDYVLVLKLL